jgi:tRNA 2-thiouridine synthesizing protein A
MAERTLDTRGLSCPLPVLKARKALQGMGPGERLRLLATDPKAVDDVAALCEATGHRLVESDIAGPELLFVIERHG